MRMDSKIGQLWLTRSQAPTLCGYCKQCLPSLFYSVALQSYMQLLLRRYPANSYSPSGPIVGGTGFYARPIDLSSSISISFTFQVYFPSGFQWVMGGKLPGIYGGKSGCSGGDVAKDCFSTRKMWRKNGAGESYIYLDKLAQVSSICSQIPNTICNDFYGYSIGRGLFSFATGSWTSVREVVSLNTCTLISGCNQDGSLSLYINESINPVFTLKNVVWRTSSSVVAIGIDFETFFGGSNSSWATPVDQFALFKNFTLQSSTTSNTANSSYESPSISAVLAVAITWWWWWWVSRKA